MTQARLWSRPLAPLVAALALGIAGPSLGLALPSAWLPWAVGALFLLFTGIILVNSYGRSFSLSPRGERVRMGGDAGNLLGNDYWWRGLPLAGTACLLFFCLGQGLYHTSLNPVLPTHHVRSLPHNTPISLLGVVQTRPITVGSDHRFELAASSWSVGPDWQSACGTVWVSGLDEATGLQPGDQVVVRLTLWPIEDLHNPGAPGRKLALARRQIFVTGRLWQHLQPVKLASAPSLSRLAAWRESARTYCRTLLASQPQPARSIFLALLLGDQNEISPSLRQAFNRTGATHVLSVSGMHLAIIAGFFTWLSFWLLRRSAWLLLRLNALKWAVFLATGPVLAYAWLAEGSPATQRSAIMILAYMLLVLLDRQRDIYSALVLAALIILVASPLQIYAVSFQLSFLAVWGLAFLYPVLMRPWQNWVMAREELPVWKRKTVLWFGTAWSVTLAATLATLPVIVTHFHQTPTYGILVNIIAAPLIGGLALVLSFLGLLVSFLPLPLTPLLFFLARLVLDFSIYLLDWAAALPGVVIRLPAPTVWQTAAYFLALISLFGVSRRLWRWTGAATGLLVIAASLAWSGLHSFASSSLVLTILDSPREMALVAACPKGVNMVVNAGAPRYFDTSAKTNTALISYLHTLRLRRLDYLAALTVTPENAGTLLALAQEFEVREFWYGGDRPTIQSFWELRNMLGDARREVKNLSLRPLGREIGGVMIQARQLPGNFPDRTSGPVLLQFDYQDKRLLIIPPAPAAWRRHCLAIGLAPGNVLILPATNLRADFLATCLSQVKPQTVIVTGSSPADPPPEVSQHPGLAWHFTRQGAVTVTVASGNLEVSQ